MKLDWQWNSHLSAAHACWCIAQSTATVPWPVFERVAVRRFSSEFVSAANVFLRALQDSVYGQRPAVAVDPCQATQETSDLLSTLADAWTSDVKEGQSTELVKSVAQVEATYRDWLPDWDYQMELRARPLSEHWEAHGPGLIYGMKQLGISFANQGTLQLVVPVLGGFGWLHRHNQSILFEAVLANEHPMLPETVRLVWLIALGSLPNQPVDFSKALAGISPAIQSASELGISQFSSEMIKLAIDQWLLPMVDDSWNVDTQQLASGLYAMSEQETLLANWERASEELFELIRTAVSRKS